VPLVRVDVVGVLVPVDIVKAKGTPEDKDGYQSQENTHREGTLLFLGG
jgi:hypothetical protein